MKKYIILIIVTCLLSEITSNAQPAWSTGLNPYGGNPLFFGTNNAYQLRFFTNNVERMKLNYTQGYTVNGYNAARNGFLLLGTSNNSLADGSNIYGGKGAFSLLHLNGEGSVFQEFGHRPWMRAGITFTANRDLSYVGLRKLSTNANEEDLTEMTIAWSDNPVGPSPGPDDMVFRFMGGGAETTVTTDFQSTGDLDGLHIARFTGEGLFGLGNTFGVNATGMSVGYARPQSLMHMSLDGSRSVWSQYTNQGVTGQTSTDGFRIGLVQNGAYLYNQENAPMIFSTNHNTDNQLSSERIRLTHIGAAGVPVTAFNNATRLAISVNPANPLTVPRSLVHIGENTGGIIPGADGARNWMNVGYLATFDSDNMYVGLKQEAADRSPRCGCGLGR